MSSVRLLSYMVIGAVLADGGITWRNWQLYVVLGLVALIATLSELITVRRCP